VQTADVASCLRVVPEFDNGERDDLLGILSPHLDRRLARWPADKVEMELSVKDRDSCQQQVTFELWLTAGRRHHLVATSSEGELRAALFDVRDSMRKQLNRLVERKEAARHG
jgi:ribosome-associated translation inhibitor RaiA